DASPAISQDFSPSLVSSAYGYLTPRLQPAVQRAFGGTQGDGSPQTPANYGVWRAMGMAMPRQFTDSGGAGSALAPALAGVWARPAPAGGSLQRSVGASVAIERGGWRTGIAGGEPDGPRFATRLAPVSGFIGRTAAPAPTNPVATSATIAGESFYSPVSRMALPLTTRVNHMLPALVATPPLRVMRAVVANVAARGDTGQRSDPFPYSAGADINRITTMPSVLSSSLASMATVASPGGVGAAGASDARAAGASALIRRYSGAAPFVGAAEPGGGVGAIAPHKSGQPASIPFSPTSRGTPARDVRPNAPPGLLTGIGGAIPGVDPDMMVHDQASLTTETGGLLLNRWSDQALAPSPVDTGVSLEGASSLTLATAAPLHWGHASSVVGDGWAGTNGAAAWSSPGAAALTSDGGAARAARDDLSVHRFSDDIARGARSLGATLSRIAESASLAPPFSSDLARMGDQGIGVDSTPSYAGAMATNPVVRSDADVVLRRFTGDLSRYSDSVSGHSAFLSRFSSAPSGLWLSMFGVSGSSGSLREGMRGASESSFGAEVSGETVGAARAAGAGSFVQRYSTNFTGLPLGPSDAGAGHTPQSASYGETPIGLAAHIERAMMVAGAGGAGSASGVTVGMGALVHRYSGALPDVLGRQATALEDSHAGSDDAPVQPRSAGTPSPFAGASLNIFRNLQRQVMLGVNSIVDSDTHSIVRRAPDAAHTMADGGRDEGYGVMADSGGRDGNYGSGVLSGGALTIGNLGDLLVSRAHTTYADGVGADGADAAFSTSNEAWDGSSMGGGALVGRATYVSGGFAASDVQSGSAYGAATMDTSPTFLQRTFVPTGAAGSSVQRRVPGSGSNQGLGSNGDV
ncbi:MAG: hypothetical protein LC769_01125, partial [Chloroflexi bacterium]|nr:hypothetical protein [Chloroflexota bacterium]